jgi:prepilin-type N-terminal cleavage/methylation domain-containing protein
MQYKNKQNAFTIVELLIVIVVIGILAAITIVAFNGVNQRAAVAGLQSELKSSGVSLESYKVINNDTYPATLAAAGISDSDAVTYEYTYTPETNEYCITAYSVNFDVSTYYIDNTSSGVPLEGTCPGHTSGSVIVSTKQIFAGGFYTCALVESLPYCWGRNAAGQLGNGSITDSDTPVAVTVSGQLAGKVVTDLTAGYEHTCAVADQAAYCWGRGNVGQIGNGYTGDTVSPTAVNSTGVLSGRTVSSIVSSNGTHTCAIADGLPFCWGAGSFGRLGTGFSPSYSATPAAVNVSGVLAGKTTSQLSGGGIHTCAIANDEAFCWGRGSAGQLGRGASTDSNVPVAVSVAGVLAGRTVTDVATGGAHSCVVADSLPFCWGTNANGQLGDNTNTTAYSPVAVLMSGALSGKTVTDIVAGEGHTCVIADNEPFCWGMNTYGQLGDGTTIHKDEPVPVDVTGVLSGKQISDISTGSYHTCVVADDEFYCWGMNTYGQLGDASTTQSAVPVPVEPLPI